MPHETALIATIAVGLSVAFAGGFLALRLRLPPIVGYLLAGIVVGPFTPGFIADVELAPQLAEIGVILLMFGVGIHFSLSDLLAVRGIAIPGAIAQIAVATAMGIGLAYLWGWGFGAGLVLGFALSVASTVVLLRALMQRDEIDSTQGRVAVSWLIVEDLFIVLALVMIPVLAGPLGGDPGEGSSNALVAIALTLGKVVLLVALMLFVGARVIPWLLVQVARTGSKEMFTLAVLSIALGVAFGSAALFGVSLALGAFLAGLVISEPDMSHRAAEDALPLRDAFAVLFFVSVGMLFDPQVLIESPDRVLAVIAIIVVGKTVAAGLIVLALGYPIRIALTVAAALAQIGEFSFILAEVGLDLNLLPEEGRSLILAGAIFSITLNSVLFLTIDPIERWVRSRPRLAAIIERRGAALSQLPETAHHAGISDHVVLCGYGRVGQVIGQTLRRWDIPYVVIEMSRVTVEQLREEGIDAIYGDASNRVILEHAHLSDARALVVAIPDPPAIQHIVEYARQVNPDIDIVVRTHSERERQVLHQSGVGQAVMGELELALEMARFTLDRFNVDEDESQAVMQELRYARRNTIDAMPL